MSDYCKYCADKNDGFYGSWAADCPIHDKPASTATVQTLTIGEEKSEAVKVQEAADAIDPWRWSLGLAEIQNMQAQGKFTEEDHQKMMQGVYLRRYASILRDIEAASAAGKSLIITKIGLAGKMVTYEESPEKHKAAIRARKNIGLK